MRGGGRIPQLGYSGLTGGLEGKMKMPGGPQAVTVVGLCPPLPSQGGPVRDLRHAGSYVVCVGFFWYCLLCGPCLSLLV